MPAPNILKLARNLGDRGSLRSGAGVLSKDRFSVHITITGNKLIGTLEKEFEKEFGLYVQVCYSDKKGERFYSSGFEKLPKGVTEEDMKRPEIAALFEELNDDRKTLSNFNKMKKEENCKKGVWK
jgi:hypothetical protein